MNVRTPLRITAALTLLSACGSGNGRVEEVPATTVAVTTTAAVATTLAATTTAATTSVVTTAAPTTTSTTAPSTTRPGSGEFGLAATLRLEAPAGGADVVMAASDDTVYIALDPSPAVRVTAVDIATGTIRWTTTLTEDGGFGWSIGATSLGVLVPYSEASNPDGDAMRLTLLAADTGQRVWTVDTTWLYEVNNGLNPYVADVWLGEDEPGLLDLSSGQMMSMGDQPWAFGATDVLMVDGQTIRRGPNPFDPASMHATTVPFPVDEAVAVGDVVVLRSGDDLVGLVDGQEVWRAPLPASSWVRSPLPDGPPLIAVMASREGKWEPVLVELLQYDAAGVRSIDGVPAEFTPTGVAQTSAGGVVFGYLGAWESGTRSSVLLRVESGSLTRLDTSGITPEPDFQWSISGLLLDQQEGEIVMRAVPDLDVVASFPTGMFSTENDTAYVTVGADGLVVSIYR